MIRFYRLICLCCVLFFFTGCKNKTQELQSDIECKDKVQEIQSDSQRVSFGEIVSSIRTIELPFTFFCGVDSCIPTEQYDSAIVKLSPKNSGIIGRLSSKGNKEYIIFGFTGDIIYPYLYIYDENGQQLDSLYLHIGPCLGDESMIISNKTIINKNYSINMIDTTQYVHYNDNIKIVDSIFITKRNLKLNDENFYVIANEDRYKLKQE
ncbi:hypothetical protein FACS189437_08910 [Bacteroidia bacterium]|nr:hypothetical protein FACS189437_08910 [Bacteroidia bacterium]